MDFDEPFGQSLNPPLAWTQLENRPDWCTDRSGVRIVTDGQNRGQAAGFLAPPAGTGQYLNVAERRPTPAPSPTNNRLFHDNGGVWNMTNDAGELAPVQIGSVAFCGGHSDQLPEGERPRNIGEGSDFLGRRGRWQDKHGDLAVYGRAYDVPGGKLFLGAAYPWLTLRDALSMNATGVSGEWWYNPEVGREDFAGAAPVLRTALVPGQVDDLRLAASSVEGGPGGLECYDDGAGPIVCVWRPVASSVLPVDVPTVAAMETGGAAAVLSAEDVEDMKASIATLTAKMRTVETALAQAEMARVDETTLTGPIEVAALAERLAQLEQVHDDLDRKNARATESPDHDTGT